MKGIGVSPGISMGRARWVVRQNVAPAGGLLDGVASSLLDASAIVLLDGAAAIQTEVAKFRTAVTRSTAEIEALINQSSPTLPAAAAAILETHIGMITDPQLESDVLEKIEGERRNAIDAVHAVISRLADTFRNMDDAYFRERAADIGDIGQRILRHLIGVDTPETGPGQTGPTPNTPQTAPNDPHPIPTSLNPNTPQTDSDRLATDPIRPPTQPTPTSPNTAPGTPQTGPNGPFTDTLNTAPITDKALPLILLAEDLTPSETITMDLSQVAGLALITGGKTSHAAILARMRSLPAIVGCGEDLRQINDDDELILDGGTGEIHIHPNATQKEAYQQKKSAHTAQAHLLASLKDRPAITTDGTAIHLLVNISKVEDMQEVVAQGGEGVGLFRTEFLYMERSSFPTEEEQFLYYRDLALRCGDRPLTIRTLDIGGDKPLPYFPLPKEDNPFLGYRAIRISLDKKDIFLTQLKAILRAGVFGKIKILLPMIGDVGQLRKAKTILEEARQQLKKQGILYNNDIPVGIMIEVPSAALTADLLAKEADFFSIGTNDLCQYVLAADRLNQYIGDVYDPYHPALLRLIHTTIREAQQQHIPVSLCGEMAADPLATLLLAGMGLTEFSMNAPSISSIKNIIINNSLEKASKISQTAMRLSHSADIIQYLQEVNV